MVMISARTQRFYGLTASDAPRVFTMPADSSSRRASCGRRVFVIPMAKALFYVVLAFWFAPRCGTGSRGRGRDVADTSAVAVTHSVVLLTN
ncbi:hypothetical protein GN244_ATG09395 [Phytophthora infestans]|uniref:Uncharacterized protein n=1 Tax=Phytophthora infestans TaxID=4787 RepID=A0A833T884_PHYIN|nr:hypothetical protein GN244_ATG09395 [Phytophthora infestans]KAF4138254.1 hypothetical protein GN958_ATG12551 [Phytophthora infestans]